MIKLDLSVDDIRILVDLLDTAISEIRMEIMQTDNRDYRKMLQTREAILKNLHLELTEKLPEKLIKEIV
ncbi:hypothetical protein [Leptolinea tardivitalis]|uniref:Uncharacterized protein n=1 Tax=Leptolinea tardivitalis TaxID=229920 RepID=A0A0N8GLT9_9CHLR|nr:hypothetical protein [Leptolinea tardivitalis]KPL73426.1 hypothetical protein ADM99_04315 [Leptolinea tardivitalis]GAP21584.1 hypothetical protein LTAR_01795 [Leptolinea tardivitalis]